jgi:hypothetical protein
MTLKHGRSTMFLEFQDIPPSTSCKGSRPETLTRQDGRLDGGCRSGQGKDVSAHLLKLYA